MGKGGDPSNTKMLDRNTPIVKFRARRRVHDKCPFGNETVEFHLYPGGCVSLTGNSGLGKTTLATVLTNLPGHSRVLKTLGIELEECEWAPSIPTNERCGVLFQQTTLLDELTVAGNLAIALKLHQDKFPTKQARDARIKQLMTSVGLDYDKDGNKRPTELSGGMGRRASLALQLAQHKRVIVLDEPFTGLDYDAAMSVSKELIQLRTNPNTQTAFVLISHEPHLSKVIMDPTKTVNNTIVELVPPPTMNSNNNNNKNAKQPVKPSLFGTSFRDRFVERLLDYTFYSLPLIALAFTACGLAIAMLSADLLERLDINDQVLDLVDTEVRPLIKMLTGSDATALQMMGIRFKVNSMLSRTVPPAKATLYAIGITKLFVLEVGPLLTALLLCGRIGGSYAGKVGTMQATAQNKLLRILGINPQWWTLAPSLLAAIIASPILTSAGTGIALFFGGWVGPKYNIGSTTQYYDDLKDSLFPELRITSFAPLWEKVVETAEDGTERITYPNSLGSTGGISSAIRLLFSQPLDWSVTYETDSIDEVSWYDTGIELFTYPPIYHILKSIAFITIIMTVAEMVARVQPNLTPRGVPSVITFSVVTSGLLVIMADWGFSQVWLLRH